MIRVRVIFIGRTDENEMILLTAQTVEEYMVFYA